MADRDPDAASASESAPGPGEARRPVRRRSGSEPLLPQTTSDERDVGWGEIPEPDDDEGLRREVPPHHGG